MLKRKTKILVFTLIVIGLSIGLILFVKLKTNRFPKHCYNNIRDRGEGGIDCEGTCPNKCSVLNQIVVLWAKIVPAGPNNNHLVALVKNSNELYGASQFDYKFSVINENGKVIFSREGNSYILPHSTKYLFAMNVGPVNPRSKINLDLANIRWQRFNAYQEPTLLVINQQLRNIEEGGFKTELTGRLVNDSVYNLRTVKVKVVLYDNSNSPIAINETYVGDLLTKERRDIRLLWKKYILKDSLSKIDVRPETDVFKENNFLRDYQFQHVNVKYNEGRLQ